LICSYAGKRKDVKYNGFLWWKLFPKLLANFHYHALTSKIQSTAKWATNRPEFNNIGSATTFNKWYWLKEELVEICKALSLPSSGSKSELRNRIIFALNNEGKVKLLTRKAKNKSRFNWAKSRLTPHTTITDNVSFGPNFRRFMQRKIEKKFVCHSDFMDWVKSNHGKTLADAIETWHELDARKQDPNFKRTIAENNMLAQYTRDFLADNEGKTLKDANAYWLLKKQLPNENGFVKYDKTNIYLK